MALQLPPGDFKAFLFDCDGTIADSMPLHYKAWTRALNEQGCTSFTEELFYAWGGRPVGDIISDLNRHDGLQMDVEATAHRKEQYYYELLDELEPVHDVLEVIRAWHGKVKYAVVSGSTRESVEKSLKTLGLMEYFEAFSCFGDYANPKPAPDPFLLGAKLLGVEPGACLVFEDAAAGIESAKAAGMAWVKIPLPFER